VQILSSSISSWGNRLTSSVGATVGTVGTLLDGSFTDGIKDRAQFSLGDVTNLYDNIAGSQHAFNITITVLLLNDTRNIQGVQLGGAANYTQTNKASPTRSVSSVITVQEPNLRVTLSVLNPTTYWNAGDIIQFSILVSHITSILNAGERISYSPAFSVNMRNLFGSSLSLMTGSVALSANYPLSPSVNVITTGNVAGDASVVVDVGTMVVGSGGSSNLNITFSARITNSAVVGLNINNPASITYYSVPQSYGTGRYYATSNQTSISFIDTSTVQHTVSAKSVSQFSSTQTSVGETLTFLINVTFPEGTSVNVTISHDLAPTEYRNSRLRLTSAVISFMGSSLSTTSGLAVGSSGVLKDNSFSDGIMDMATFNFSNVINAYNNLNDIQDTLTITVTAVVVDDSVNNVRGATVGAAVSFTNAYRGSPIRVVTPAITIQEPLLSTSLLIIGQGTTVWHGNQDVPMIITLKHVQSGSPVSSSGAFNVRITDNFGNGLYLKPGTVSLSSNYPLQAGVNVITSGNTAGDTSMIVDIFYMPLVAGSSADLNISVTATVIKNVLIVSTVSNLVNVNYTSVPTGGAIPGRMYTSSATQSIYIADTSSFRHAVTSPSIPQLPLSSAAIGETFVFTINVTLPYGLMQGVILTEDLAPNEYSAGRLKVLSSSVVYLGPGFSCTNNLQVGSNGTAQDGKYSDGISDMVVFNFGDVTNVNDDVTTNTDSLVVMVMVLVPNVVQNVNNTAVGAAASFAQTLRATPYRTVLSAITVFEPNMVATITIPNGVNTQRDAGDCALSIERGTCA